ncbi:MAG: GDP-L-fucose synthase [Mariprofundales bacterium]|nr:GDP-L-fucose synthase [Mariprofundales bacterium]
MNKQLSPNDPIFVAGHRGLVGSALVRALQRQGFTNLLLRTSSELDLCDGRAVDAFFSEHQPVAVLLAAAKVGGIHANSSYPADFIRNNLMIQNSVIDGAYRAGVKKLLFLGSSCIYPRLAKQPIREEALLTGALEPTNEWYAIAKIAGIKMCQAYRRQYGFNAISAMPTNLYGPGDNFDLENSHVLPAMIRKFHLAKLAAAGELPAIAADEARRGRIPDAIVATLGLQRVEESFHTIAPPQMQLWGTGNVMREFLHVDDLAAASLFLLQNYDREEIINIGCGEDQTIRQLAEIVQRVVGFDGEVVWDASKPDGTPKKQLDVTRLTTMGWRPTIGLEDGIRAVYRLYCGNYSDHS